LGELDQIAIRGETGHHTDDDLVEAMNLDTGHAIATAAMAAVAGLAEPIGDCYSNSPWFSTYSDQERLYMLWQPMEAKVYQIWLKQGEEWIKLGETRGTRWILPLKLGQSGELSLIAISDEGCQSRPGFNLTE
jgi:hypothetical protein